MPSVPYAQFVRDLASPGYGVPSVVAVAGDEDFMRRDALGRLRRFVESKNYTWERLDPDEVTAQDVMSRLRSSSLFGDRSAVVIKSVRVQNRAEVVVRLKDDLAAYLERPSKENLLVFDGQTWNGSMAIPRAVKKDFLVVECESFKPWQGGEIERFIESLAQGHGLRLGRGVAGRLREDCGDVVGLCDTELAKLALVVKGEVTVAHLDTNLRSRGADHALELVDAVARGDMQAAFRLGKGVFSAEDSGDVLQFMGLLESNMRKLGKLQWVLASGGLRGPEAATKAGYNPRSPQVTVALATAGRMSSATVRDVYRVLVDADRMLKGGGGGNVSAGAVVAQTVEKLCVLLAAPTRSRA